MLCIADPASRVPNPRRWQKCTTSNSKCAEAGTDPNEKYAHVQTHLASLSNPEGVQTAHGWDELGPQARVLNEQARSGTAPPSRDHGLQPSAHGEQLHCAYCLGSSYGWKPASLLHSGSCAATDNDIDTGG
jgi:hypothetical protein